MTDKEVAISVRNVSKEFKSYLRSGSGDTNPSSPRTLSSLLGKSKYEKIQVLKDVSFDIMKGEMIGILGRNGAGKSTLLRIIAGIIQPTKGSVKVNGKITSLLGFSVGLDKQLTARENIKQYGLILGLSSSEIDERINDVLEFAELEKYADFQVSHFSSGMKARLAFSTTLLITPDILLLDEALAVGDYFFHQKSVEAFERIKEKAGTIILVSHQLSNIKRYCDRAMLLHDGKVESIGDPETVIKRYLELGLDDPAANVSQAMAEMESEDDDDELVKKLRPATNSADKAPVSEKALAPVSEKALAAVEAPTNLFPDGSPFLEGLTKIQARKTRWRAKVLVENNAFAISGKSILDLRCQNGQFIHAALQTGAKYVEAIEKQQDSVDLANENLKANYGEGGKYKINKGSLLSVLRKIKPNTFDTIFCFGVMNKLINNAGLMQQIVRIQPSYLIVDVGVSESSEEIVELTAENEDAPSSGEDSESSGKDISLPSKSAVELLLKTNKFAFEYIDWSKSGITNWTGLEEYLQNRRISIIASKL